MLHDYMGTSVHVYNGSLCDCIVRTVDDSTDRQYTEHKKITASLPKVNGYFFNQQT